ncbi:hypothetical protein EB796_014070 [Bugula neritina]|uniref:Uncharacterized protein n=1 Tax=Bugula neritina TaxID=10212 RepID=A0A7J7JQ93_BUGNE|nr:hypothetical protein EB796_014070 [Bugula neritina]
MLSDNGEVVLEDDFIRNKQRLDELCHTRHMAVWHDHSDIAGNKYYTDQIWSELIARGVPLSYKEKGLDLKHKLCEELKGVKRPPAILCSDDSGGIDIDEYEISKAEPLHDFKNIINKVMRELVYATEDSNLKQIISKILLTLKVANREMKGRDCRLNLIKVTGLLQQHIEVANCNKICKMLLALVELQQLAYADENKRTPKMILRAYNQSYVFATTYISLFCGNSSVSSSQRSLFGMPFHSIVVHLPEMLRLINGQSIVAEQAERHFNKIRQLTLNTSNRRASSLITNCLFRIAMQRKKSETSYHNTEYNLLRVTAEKSLVSKAARGIYLGRNTIIKNQIFQDCQTAALVHLSRIADYIEHGPNIWYKVHDSAIEFLDGLDEPEYRAEGPKLTHFRSSNWADLSDRIEKSWTDCLRQKTLLKIQIVNSLEESEQPKKSMNHRADNKTLVDHMPSLYAALREEKSKAPVTSSLAHSSDSSVECEPLNNTSSSFISDIPSLHKENSFDPQVNSDSRYKSQPICEPATSVEEILRRSWPFDMKTLNNFFKCKNAMKQKPSLLAKTQYRAAAKNVKPYLKKMLDTVRKEEKDLTLKKINSEGILLTELTAKNEVKSQYGKQIKALAHLLNQLEKF